MASIVEPAAARLLKKLPPDIQRMFRLAFEDPHHPALELKPLTARRRVRKNSWQIAPNYRWRAIGEKVGGDFHWYWVGSREDARHMHGN